MANNPTKGGSPKEKSADHSSKLSEAVLVKGDSVNLLRRHTVSLTRTTTGETDDLAFSVVIRKATEAISFKKYNRFMNMVLCNQLPDESTGLHPHESMIADEFRNHFADLSKHRFLPFNDTDAYRLLKVATEAFLTIHCGIVPNSNFRDRDLRDLIRRVDLATDPDLEDLWENYLEHVNGTRDEVLPYLALVRRKLSESNIKDSILPIEERDLPQGIFGIIRQKLVNPCLLELIWSYWQEQGMLVQTLNALSLRFQNVRGVYDRDPLAMLEIDALRPLNNILWGYIQDEQHRLTVVRRAYEYDHHYGMTLQGRAVPQLRSAESRSKFIEAFHNLLYLATVFFKEDDDTTVFADGFPLMNALRDVHFILAQGAHNQFGDLPSTARQEMLLQQWLLARPEFREFLPSRVMVAYPEEWMDRVDAMKSLQGWTDTSVLHFRNLAIFGEQLLLSIRYGNWGDVSDPVQAANWARYWRAEIQGYIHAYRAVAGIDLSAEITDSRQASARYLQPSFHLAQRLTMQRSRQLALPQRRI
jgi:hypothetical protein